MGVVVDVVHAVTVIAIAARAVSKFQVGILCIRPAADGAFVVVRLLAAGALIAVGPVGIGLCRVCLLLLGAAFWKRCVALLKLNPCPA